jgi:iron(III) transport system ATP-binding protein
MFMADRMAVMRAGRVIQVDTPDAIYRAPASAFVTKFLGFVNSAHATVVGGRVASSLGEHVASGLGDGTLVDVLVRPEGVRLAEAGGAVEATVVSRHRLGSDCLIVLRLADGSLARARLSRSSGPGAGCRVSLDIDPEAVFLFPCDTPPGLA